MKLVINTRGTKISKANECFLITVDGIKEEISSSKVEKILITTSANITTISKNQLKLTELELGTQVIKEWVCKS